MPAHADDHDPVERRVGLAVAAAEEPMPVRDPARGGNRAGAAQLRKRGVGSDPGGVVAGNDHHLGRRVGTNPEHLAQGRRRPPGEGVERLVVVADLGRQCAPTCGERPQGVFDRCRRVDDLTRSEGGAALDELPVGERLECFAERARRVHEERLEGDDRGTPGLDGRIAGDLDLADHLCGPVGGLRDGGRDAREHRPRGGLGVKGVVLAVVAPLAPVAMVDLDDTEPLSAHEAREAGPVGAGAFGPECFDGAERARPGHQVGIARPVGGRPERRKSGAEVIDRHGDMLVFVGVDADDHLDGRIVPRDAVRHVGGPFTDWRHRLVGRADRTVTGLSSQAPMRSLPSRPDNIWMRAAQPGRQISPRTRSRSSEGSEPAGQQHDYAHSRRSAGSRGGWPIL